MYMQSRSVTRDAKAISLGLSRVQAEIKHLTSNKKTSRAVRQRLIRLREAETHLIDNPKESADLVSQLKEIQNG